MKLNLGAGDHALPGYSGVDLTRATYIHDLRRRPWPFDAGSVEAIVASHILEHFD